MAARRWDGGKRSVGPRRSSAAVGAIRNTLWKAYSKLENALLPGLVNPQLLYRNLLISRVHVGARWLDLGCGRKLFSNSLPGADRDQHVLVERSEIVVGMDRDLGALRSNEYIRNRVVGDMRDLPFLNGRFDLVSANMVVEHMEHPDIVLSEIHRILAPGGIFLMHTPNVSNYKVSLAFLMPDAIKKGLIRFFQDRREADVFPTYYRMNTGKRVSAMAQSEGFYVAGLHFAQGPADTVMLGPLVILELLIMKLLNAGVLARFRSNIISVLRK
jgi:SAM-dependent methyltransferase